MSRLTDTSRLTAPRLRNPTPASTTITSAAVRKSLEARRIPFSVAEVQVGVRKSRPTPSDPRTHPQDATSKSCTRSAFHKYQAVLEPRSGSSLADLFPDGHFLYQGTLDVAGDQRWHEDNWLIELVRAWQV